MKRLIGSIILFTLLSWSLAGKAQTPGSRDTRSQVQQTYTGQVGVRERSGRNDGVMVEVFLRSVGLGAGHSWCAAFVNWCLVQNKVTTCNSGWVPSWFPASKLIYQQGKIKKRSPITGDTFGIYFGSKKRLAHIGFIDQWTEGKYAKCIEGNTNEAGSREGDGVYRKYRLKSQIHSVSDWIGY